MLTNSAHYRQYCISGLGAAEESGKEAILAILQVNVRPATRLRRLQSFRRGELASCDYPDLAAMAVLLWMRLKTTLQLLIPTRR